MQSNNKNEVFEGLRNAGGFLLIAVLTVLIANSPQPGWMLLFTPLACGFFTFWISGWGGKYMLLGAGLGLIASLLWYFFGI